MWIILGATWYGWYVDYTTPFPQPEGTQRTLVPHYNQRHDRPRRERTNEEILLATTGALVRATEITADAELCRSECIRIKQSVRWPVVWTDDNQANAFIPLQKGKR